VSRIATQTIIADVIKNWNISSLPLWDRLNKPSIHKTMDSVKLFINPNLTISKTCNPIPIPTTSFFIDSNFSKYTTDRFRIRIVNNKKIGDVHNTSITIKHKNYNSKEATWQQSMSSVRQD